MSISDNSLAYLAASELIEPNHALLRIDHKSIGI